jgi:hypothetical protein
LSNTAPFLDSSTSVHDDGGDREGTRNEVKEAKGDAILTAINEPVVVLAKCLVRVAFANKMDDSDAF